MPPRAPRASPAICDGGSRNYATTFVYNARSQVTQELFGSQTPLYHKLQYNIRGQLLDLRVSAGSDINGSWNRGALQFFYESTYTHGPADHKIMPAILPTLMLD
jgi:hypothetical protein